MDKQENKLEALSDISIISRKEMSLTGVKDVKSFDEQEVVADTVLGLLLIKGSSLAVKTLSLDKGLVKISGCIDAVIYNKNTAVKSKQSVVKRLFS